MNVPTSTFINFPSDFLSNIFSIAGYVINNLFPLLQFIIGISIVILIIAIIIDAIKK